jgi:hypothetical protein
VVMRFISLFTDMRVCYMQNKGGEFIPDFGILNGDLF